MTVYIIQIIEKFIEILRRQYSVATHTCCRLGMGTKVRPRVGVTDRLADISLHFGVDSIPDTDSGSGFHCSQHHEIGHFIRSLVNCYSFRGARPVANNGYNHSHNRISGLKVTTSPTLHSVV